MVIVSFVDNGKELLRISVSYGQPVELMGDHSWLDYDFKVPSQRLGYPVSFHDDPEEWARSLPEAYADTALQAQVVKDTALEGAIDAARARAVHTGKPALQEGTTMHNLKVALWRQPRMLALAAVLFLILAAVLIWRLETGSSFTPVTTPLLTPTQSAQQHLRRAWISETALAGKRTPHAFAIGSALVTDFESSHLRAQLCENTNPVGVICVLPSSTATSLQLTFKLTTGAVQQLTAPVGAAAPVIGVAITGAATGTATGTTAAS
jgi:hypothetical protein